MGYSQYRHPAKKNSELRCTEYKYNFSKLFSFGFIEKTLTSSLKLIVFDSKRFSKRKLTHVNKKDH